MWFQEKMSPGGLSRAEPVLHIPRLTRQATAQGRITDGCDTGKEEDGTRLARRAEEGTCITEKAFFCRWHPGSVSEGQLQGRSQGGERRLKLPCVPVRRDVPHLQGLGDEGSDRGALWG